MTRIIILFAFLLTADHSVMAQADWTLKKDENGIKLYTKSTEDSPIKSIKAILEFDVPASAVIALIGDIPAYSTWVYQCKKSEVIKQISPTSGIFHHMTEAPWPFDDRDHVSIYEVTRDPNTKVITVNSHAVTGIYPEQEGYVRLKKSRAKWILTPIGENKVAAIYELSFDPEGSVPAWLINMFITEGPYQRLSKMKQKVHEKKYLDAPLPFKK
jgi:hypothetical protein